MLIGTVSSLVFILGARQEPAPSQELIAHVTWSIYHEGCRVFSSPHGEPLHDEIRPLPELRDCFLRTQRHNPDATKLIENAPDQTLSEVITAAVQTIPTAYSLNDNVAWVAVHEGQLAAFRRLDNAGEYEGIREIYASKQFHNPNARNLLAASKNSDIHQLIVTLLRTNPPPVTNFFTNQPDEHLVIVNPRALSAETVAIIQASIFNLFQQTEWPKVEIKEQTSLHSFAETYYGAKVDSAELAPVLPKIRERNQMGVTETLNAGEELALPPIPTVPQGATKSSIFQAIDLPGRRVFPKDTETGTALSYTKSTLDQSSSWILAGSPLMLSAFVANLPPAAQKDLNNASYSGPTYQTGHLILTSGPCNVAPLDDTLGSEAFHSSSTPLTINQTSLRYYVLDFFDLTVPPDACPHGKKVLEVVKQELDSRGAGALFATNIKPIELDFFHHANDLSHYIEDYINAIGGSNTSFLLDVLSALKKRDPNSVTPYETPLLYLQAVYYAILKDPNAVVVSSSFYTESDTFNLLPDIFAQTSNVLVLSAVDDNPGDADTFVFEPIRGLYERRRDFPVLLVGGLQRAGTTYGMSSASGDGVSCLGYADGWGNATTCIRPPNIGTSFATPSVATTAFLARIATQQATGHIMSAKVLRDRLLRAVNLVAGAPTGYVAPGIPTLDWLSGAAPGVLVDSANHVVPVNAVTGTIGYTHTGSNGSFTVPFQNGQDGISALEQAGNATYIFDNGRGSWLRVQPHSLAASIVLSDGSTRTFSLSDLSNNTFKIIAIF
jgi:hypothetical protein